MNIDCINFKNTQPVKLPINSTNNYYDSELLQDPSSNGLLKNFQDSILPQKIDKRRITEVYSYIGARMSKSDWLEYPSVSMMRLAAQLAWEGHLPSVENIRLVNTDLSDIHQNRLGKLSSIVTDSVVIVNITPASLDIILESVRCPKLWLANMTLTKPQTQALVTAMTERLERVRLRYDVTLDIQTLCQYNGRGTCWKLQVRGDKRKRYEENLRHWTAEVGWAVTAGVSLLIMERK